MPDAIAGVPDADLVRRIRVGDEIAFRTLFDTYFPRLTAFAERYVGRRAIAEELAADVFLSLWRRRSEWRPHSGVRAYVYRAVRNQAHDYLRRQHREAAFDTATADEYDPPELGQMPPPADDVLVARERIDAVWHAIESLPAARRLVLTLRWRDGLSFEEIAAVLDTTPAAVQMQLSRALKLLRTMLPDVLH